MCLKIWLLATAILAGAMSARAVEPNVVIEEMTQTVRLIPEKDGRTLKKVDDSMQFTFRANRVGATAHAIAYYDDFIKIDKASGGKTAYGPYFSDDIFFSDSKACLIAVELKKKGDKAKATLKRTFTKPEFFTRLFLPEAYNVEKKTVTIEIPTAMAGRFRIVERNLPEGKFTKHSESNGEKTIITYTLTDLETPTIFADAPSINKTAPQLLITGHFADTDEVYRYLRSYLPDNDPGAAAVESKAREITAGCATDADRIAAITDYVHETIRYVAVEHGEFGHRPDLPSEVMRKSFGDCKGSAMLLKTMFRAAGLDGRLAWVGSKNVTTKWSEAPDISSGDHMIAAVMTGDSLLFVDGTARHTRAGRIPSGLWGCEALVENGPRSCIVATIPRHGPDTEFKRDSLTLTIQPSGIIEASGVTVMSGSRAEGIRAIVADISPAKRGEFYNALFENILSGSHAEESQPVDSLDAVTIRGRSTLSAAVKKVGPEIYVDLNPAEQFGRMKFKTEKERKVGGVINGQNRIECILRLNVPDGHEISDLPADVHIDNEWISGDITTTGTNAGRTVERRFGLLVKNSLVPFESLEAYNLDINRLTRACASVIVLKEKQN